MPLNFSNKIKSVKHKPTKQTFMRSKQKVVGAHSPLGPLLFVGPFQYLSALGRRVQRNPSNGKLRVLKSRLFISTRRLLRMRNFLPAPHVYVSHNLLTFRLWTYLDNPMNLACANLLFLVYTIFLLKKKKKEINYNYN